METYVVLGTRVRSVFATDGTEWRSTEQIPAFYVDASCAAEALATARDILNPPRDTEMHLSTCRYESRDDYGTYSERTAL